MAGFDLSTYNSAGGDDTTRLRRQGRISRSLKKQSILRKKYL
jgi:hypothetical protein